MRLRLRIERNELPPVQVLHAIPHTQLSQTISQFLQTINALFPLESTTWDISDYAVLVGGYEATHYTEVGQAFKDEDEVVIKPLGFAELRARTLTGRDQITEDGRHLLDGIPFGRPMLKRPRRPEVTIPPRKRHRTEDVDDQQVVVHQEEIIEGDEDDDDFEDLENEVDSEDDQEQGSASDKSSEDESDSESESASSEGTSEEESESESEDESESESGSSQSWGGIKEPVVSATEASQAHAKSSTHAGQHQGLPRQGGSRTKERNDRRRDSRKLKHLKAAGILPPHARLSDMHEWQHQQGLDDDGFKATALKARMETERNRLLDQIASGGVEISRKTNISDEDDGPPEVRSSRPSATMTETLDGGSGDAASTQITVEAQQAASASALEARSTPRARPDPDRSPDPKRARLDTRSMNRLVFGSLGLRTPKTQEEKDTLQKKLSARTKRTSVETNIVEPIAELSEEADEDPESWRQKIELAAVECVDEDVQLSAPPFPFQQRWDPQYQFSKKRKRSRNYKSDAQTNGHFIETYDKYNQNGGGDALNYDDPEEDGGGDDPYWEEGALLENDDEAEMESDDGFPALPANHASLPVLAEIEAQVGDYITYQELSVSANTGWEPTIVSQTAKLESKAEDGAWALLLKQRQPKEYDDEGNRVYKKFEMEDFSDDGSDNQVKTVTWAELQSPKLLLRGYNTEVS